MALYVAIHPAPEVQIATIWDIDEFEARRIDGPQNGNVVQFKPPLIEVEGLAGFTFRPLRLPLGHYYRRMARPMTFALLNSTNPEIDVVAAENGRSQLTALREQLERIFRTVHPEQQNFGAFGHDIRNVIILAATEVETQWKGVLAANGQTGSGTNDYVKLLSAMKLNEYAIELRSYPALPVIKPFLKWSATAPTKSLGWYDAYNAVKHDRENNFSRATLFHAIEAVCACAIMLYAQYGTSGLRGASEIMSLFHPIQVPVWPAEEAYALMNLPQFPLTATPYRF
jgi:hypothetical protein